VFDHSAAHARIEADMRHAVTIEDLGEYANYLANYGATLVELARPHAAPEAVIVELREHADRVLYDLNNA